MRRGRGLGLGLTLGGVVSSAPAFTPASSPGLVAWLHADSLSASPVPSWSYGLGNFTNGVNRPTWSASSANVGGAKSVLYSGTQSLSTPNTSALQLTGDFTISTVIYQTGVGLPTVISKYAGTGGEFDILINGATNIANCVQYNGGTPTAVSSSAVYMPNVAFLMTIIKSGTTISFRKNMAAAGSGTNASAVSATTNAVSIGRRSDNGTTIIGEQPEIVICNQALAGTDLSNLESYLMAKYP